MRWACSRCALGWCCEVGTGTAVRDRDAVRTKESERGKLEPAGLPNAFKFTLFSSSLHCFLSQTASIYTSTLALTSVLITYRPGPHLPPPPPLPSL